MASPLFALCLTCLFFGEMAQTANLNLSSSVRQETSFLSVKTGDNLTLQCFKEGDGLARLYWYKQTLGEKPSLICSYYKYDKTLTFYDEFKNNPRFTLDIENEKNHLKITDLRISDSATYNCIHCYLYTFKISEAITVSVKSSGLNIPALVHQSASETIQPGDSVTLNCTVHTGTCDGEHSVYWFKDSEESHPGLIYTHGGRNDQCERKPNTQTHTCVYNLPMKSLNLSHAGTYYCAVASCGHILFGNGTKLDFEDEVHSFVLVYFLSGALIFTTTLLVLSAFSMYKMKKRISFQSPGLIYTHGGRNDQCERKPNTQTHTCVYNLPMKSLNLSHAGTYYCAVASCGHILFGNGTKLDFEDEVHSFVLVYFLSGALIFTTTLLVLSAFSMYKMKKRISFQSPAQMTNLNLSSSVRQETSFLSVKTGDNLTLQCFKEGGGLARRYWYKQTLGEKMKLICSHSKYDTNVTFYDEFKNNPRFTLDTENSKNHLKITDLRISDSATYNCIHCYLNAFKISEVITVSVKGSGLNIPALVHQSVSETIQPGGSVTLNCTVHTGTCGGEHSVYWFKDSEESHPGLIYTHGGRNDQCERKPNTQTHTCVYNLPMKSLNLSHAGTYYCAVASCGHILFGNGTKLDFEGKSLSR
uniref:Ig-like domain-containing protein n=1 Tax=Larimichthys crocea TaxID=215358 RepID=A0A0F8AIA7_LARCR